MKNFAKAYSQNYHLKGKKLTELSLILSSFHLFFFFSPAPSAHGS